MIRPLLLSGIHLDCDEGLLGWCGVSFYRRLAFLVWVAGGNYLEQNKNNECVNQLLEIAVIK